MQKIVTYKNNKLEVEEIERYFYKENNILNNKKNSTIKLNYDSSKIKIEFLKLKEFYSKKFKTEKTLEDIVEVYTEITNESELLNDFRLKYLNMYLFNRGIIKNKYTINELGNLIKKAISSKTNIEKNINTIKKECINSKDFMDKENQNNIIKNSDGEIKGIFFKMKKIYNKKFENEKSLEGILKIYISITNMDELFSDFRLKYLNMYLFNRVVLVYKRGHGKFNTIKFQ